MKLALCALTALLSLAPCLLPTSAEAKSVKWSCYAPDPLNPFSFVCIPSTSRP